MQSLNTIFIFFITVAENYLSGIGFAHRRELEIVSIFIKFRSKTDYCPLKLHLLQYFMWIFLKNVKPLNTLRFTIN